MQLAIITASTIIAAASIAGIANADSYAFTANLAADPAAVQSSANSKSKGSAYVTIKSDGTVHMDIEYTLEGDDGRLDADNALVGIHIHSGDATTNGPTVFGFCGQSPLPAFGGACDQEQGSPYFYDGMTCDMAPPAPCYNNGTSSAQQAMQDIINGDDMYVNIHTTKSLAANGAPSLFKILHNGDAGALGLIRGQLVYDAAGSDPPRSPSSAFLPNVIIGATLASVAAAYFFF